MLTSTVLAGTVFASAATLAPLLLDALLIASIATNGLLAGVFFVFSCAIAPGFRRLDDDAYVQAFRAINRAILNGWFLTVFLAAPVTAIVFAVISLLQGAALTTALVVAGAVGSALTFLITAARNVPLNDRLERAQIGTPDGRRAARRDFERPWNTWNLVRTLTSLGGFVCLALAAVSG